MLHRFEAEAYRELMARIERLQKLSMP